jgi:hypothetical protein
MPLAATRSPCLVRSSLKNEVFFPGRFGGHDGLGVPSMTSTEPSG